MARLDATFDSTFVPLPGGGQAPLFIRRSRRARRVALRIVPGTGEVELVVPHRASIRQGIAFAREKADWLKRHLVNMPGPVPFEDGAVIPVENRPRTIRRADDLFRGTRLTASELIVSSPPELLSFNVKKFLRDRARDALRRHAEEKSRRIGVPFRRLTVRDTATRWGSCSPDGDLSFSWRVIMAPDYVLDYLVAHEVAHLAEMNHSHRFWTIVYRIAGRADDGRDWLRDQGATLHRYGVERRSFQAL
jgi:predicted metal-dependent hydrolase